MAEYDDEVDDAAPQQEEQPEAGAEQESAIPEQPQAQEQAPQGAPQEEEPPPAEGGAAPPKAEDVPQARETQPEQEQEPMPEHKGHQVPPFVKGLQAGQQALDDARNYAHDIMNGKVGRLTPDERREMSVAHLKGEGAYDIGSFERLRNEVGGDLPDSAKSLMALGTIKGLAEQVEGSSPQETKQAARHIAGSTLQTMRNAYDEGRMTAAVNMEHGHTGAATDALNNAWGYVPSKYALKTSPDGDGVRADLWNASLLKDGQPKFEGSYDLSKDQVQHLLSTPFDVATLDENKVKQLVADASAKQGGFNHPSGKNQDRMQQQERADPRMVEQAVQELAKKHGIQDPGQLEQMRKEISKYPPQVIQKTMQGFQGIQEQQQQRQAIPEKPQPGAYTGYTKRSGDAMSEFDKEGREIYRSPREVVSGKDRYGNPVTWRHDPGFDRRPGAAPATDKTTINNRERIQAAKEGRIYQNEGQNKRMAESQGQKAAMDAVKEARGDYAIRNKGAKMPQAEQEALYNQVLQKVTADTYRRLSGQQQQTVPQQPAPQQPAPQQPAPQQPAPAQRTRNVGGVDQTFVPGLNKWVPSAWIGQPVR